MELFAIYDHLGEYYEAPFVAHNRVHAERGISDLARFQPDNPVILHSGDYSLCHLASYEGSTGIITPFPQPVFLNRLSAYMPKEQGAAVGDAIPLKSQSAITEDSADAVKDTQPAFDVESSPNSKAQNKGE